MLHSYSDVPEGPEDYKKRQEAIKKKIVGAAKGTDAKILSNVGKEADRDKAEVHDNCQMLRMLFDEGIEMYQEGDMELSAMVEDLYKSLKALVGQSKKKSEG